MESAIIRTRELSSILLKKSSNSFDNKFLKEQLFLSLFSFTNDSFGHLSSISEEVLLDLSKTWKDSSENLFKFEGLQRLLSRRDIIRDYMEQIESSYRDDIKNFRKMQQSGVLRFSFPSIDREFRFSNPSSINIKLKVILSIKLI